MFFYSLSIYIKYNKKYKNSIDNKIFCIKNRLFLKIVYFFVRVCPNLYIKRSGAKRLRSLRRLESLQKEKSGSISRLTPLFIDNIRFFSLLFLLLFSASRAFGSWDTSYILFCQSALTTERFDRLARICGRSGDSGSSLRSALS